MLILYYLTVYKYIPLNKPPQPETAKRTPQLRLKFTFFVVQAKRISEVEETRTQQHGFVTG